MTTSEPNLVLIGLRGSGKTTIARALAERQGRQWIDLDELVLGVFPDCETIRQIFQTHDEAAFREAEASVLRDVLESNHGAIVALGGGTPTAPGADQTLRTHAEQGAACIVYLRCRPDDLRERLQQTDAAHDDRPSLTGNDPLDEIDAIFAQRDEAYQGLATRTFDDFESIDQALEALEDWPSWCSED